MFRKVIDLEELPFSVNEISRPSDGIDDERYLTERIFPVIEPSSFLMKKYTYREISLGICPAAFVKLKYLPSTCIAHA